MGSLNSWVCDKILFNIIFFGKDRLMSKLITAIKDILGCHAPSTPSQQCDNCPYALFHNTASKCTQLVAETSVTYPENPAFTRRMINFYHTCHENTKITQASLWKYIIDIKSDVHTALLDDYISMSNNNLALLNSAKILADPINSEFWYGFSEPTKSRYQSKQEGPDTLWEYDVLYRLAQAWGCLPMSNPESNFPNEYPPVEDILELLDKACGVKIQIPNNYPHIIGLKTSRGIFDYRAINGLYCAKKIKDSGASSVLELGAGLGWSTYYANTLGIKDYTIVDIPMTCIASAHFLSASLDADTICFAGESASPMTQVSILPPEEFPANKKFDVVLNIDSLTEMGEEVARNYCKQIKNICRRFISINHEYHTYTVAQLLAGDKRIKNYTRNPYWLRRGYVEEIFDFE